jgi:hypothetical protein
MIYFRKSKRVVAVPVQFVGDLRESAAKLKMVSILTALAMTGLMLLIGDVGPAMADVPIGPGPTNYTEQPPPPGTCHYRTAANGETLPDPNCPPGAISPKVTPDTLDTTICKTGYTKSIRPPASITAAEKRANAASYGYSGPMSGTEYDTSCHSNLAGTQTTPGTCGSNPVHPQTRKTASNLGCMSLSAKAKCHSLRRRRPSPPIGLRHLIQSVEVASR